MPPCRTRRPSLSARTISTRHRPHFALTTRITDIADRAAAYGMPGVAVDGMDVEAVYRAAASGGGACAAGTGPTLIECKTYRYRGHSRGDPGGYRDRGEHGAWMERDPIERLAQRLVGRLRPRDRRALEEIERQGTGGVEAAVEFALASADPSPDPARNMSSPHDDGTTTPTATNAWAWPRPSATPCGSRCARDPTVFLLGEDIGVPGGFGGGFTVTLGLSDEFGRERVIDTPISEGAIVGAAVGAAMAGMRPVAEMQYGDFVFCAMDQVVNQAAKMHYMSNGQVQRADGAAAAGRGIQRGAQHGQSTRSVVHAHAGPEGRLPFDALTTPRACCSPRSATTTRSSSWSTSCSMAARARARKAAIDLARHGRARRRLRGPARTVSRSGARARDITILANMLMVHRALAAAERLGGDGNRRRGHRRSLPGTARYGDHRELGREEPAGR